MAKDIREKQITKTGFIGIIVNVLLAGFKATVGLFANAVSVILDAVNNLTDAISSIVTIVGVKLAKKKPTKKHPYGYGRIEYFSAIIVAAIVLFAGITAISESIKKIITPEQADYTAITMIIIGVAVLVKIFLGLYVKKQGKTYNIVKRFDEIYLNPNNYNSISYYNSEYEGIIPVGFIFSYNNKVYKAK